jgi:hypothetical protein
VRHCCGTQSTNFTYLVHLCDDQHQESCICASFRNEVLDKVDDTWRHSLSICEDVQNTQCKILGAIGVVAEEREELRMIRAQRLDERSNEFLYSFLYRWFKVRVNLEESSTRISFGLKSTLRSSYSSRNSGTLTERANKSSTCCNICGFSAGKAMAPGR